MKVALTGATGFIGSHILTELHEHGHQVTALVRGSSQADTVAGQGAIPAVIDLYDQPAVADLLRSAEAAVHTASPGDATSADLDGAVVDAVLGEAAQGVVRRTLAADQAAELEASLSTAPPASPER
jgi:putative NADH-flavin reductase